LSAKEAYQKKIHAQLSRWKTKFDEFMTQVEKAGSDTKLKYGEYVATLRARREEAERKLEELKAAGEETWENAKAGVEYAWDELRRATETATSIFRRGKPSPNRDEEIRLIAYHLWENKGRPEGHHVEHWLKAKAMWEEQHAQEQPQRARATRKKTPAIKPATRRAGGKTGGPKTAGP
jgi:hypothetical protein